MITNDEIQLSKMSYTDKDFPSIYTDLLDLAKQLTNKWDPSTSNESDPGVVLLKEAAFIADHSNYNIDKNILENFLPSATQEESVRNLMEINGYNPEYYVSATGRVNISYKSSDDRTSGDNFIPFSIPAFTLQISDDEGKVYTQTSTFAVSIENLASTCDFIEGTINTLVVNGSENVILENLDSDNRIYFPVQQVAQNGIFIKNSDDADSNLWTKVEYLQVQDLKSKVYKVGYDSKKKLPYVEFPSDIATIIGSGLNIRYIVTSGIEGNTGAGKLTSIISPDRINITSDYQILCSDFTLSNPSSITNGKNPETINDMYKSFKKVVGTFNTLVTCRDYSNAVNGLKDNTSNQNLVGNSVVTDINSDYNNSFKVICFDEYGLFYDNLSICKGINKFRLVTDTSNPQNGDIRFNIDKFECYNNGVWEEISSISYEMFVSATEAMNRFDLCLYALNMFSYSLYSESYPSRALDYSFMPISDTTVEVIQSVLNEGYKCISHNFRNNAEGDIICFKNYLPLNVTITPYSKVSKTEEYEIFQSIYQALSKNFNSSQVDFGEEIPWDDVYDVILNCDSRIKNVRLEDFEYNTVAMRKTADSYEEVSLNSNPDIVKTLIAKNVLAGRVCLFDFNEDFVYEYGELAPNESSEITSNEYSDISKLSTEVEINLDSDEESELTAEASDIYSVKIGYSEVESLDDELVLKLCQNPEVPAGAPETIVINGNSTYNFTDEKYILKIYKVEEDSTESWLTEFDCNPSRYFVFKNNTNDNITLTYTGEVSPTSKTTVGKNDITITNYIERTSYVEGNLALNEYELKENEYINIESPNYYSDIVFPTYAYYNYSGYGEGSYIPKDIDYTLSGNEVLTMLTISDNVPTVNKYTAGDIVRANFKVEPISDNDKDIINKEYTDTVTGSKVTLPYKVLNPGEEIAKRTLEKTVLKSVDVPCYWITNNPGNTLFKSTETEVILDNGESFFYSNSTLDTIVVLGPGTKLKRSDNYQWSITDTISTESISNNGLAANPAWVHRDFSQNNFEILEMSIVSLSQGDKLSLYNCTGLSTTLSNEWKIFNTQIRYTTDGEVYSLPQNEYYIRSRFDLNTDNKSITLKKTDNSTQSISITSIGGETVISPTEVNTATNVNFNTDINLTGGDNINFNSLPIGTLNLKSYNWVPVEYRKVIFTELSDDDDITLSGTYYNYNKVLVSQAELTNIINVLGSDTSYAHYKEITVVYIGELYTKSTYDPSDVSSYNSTIYDKSTVYSIILSDEGHIILPLQYHKKYRDSINTSLEAINSNNYVLPILFSDTTGSSSINNKISITVNNDNYNFELKELDKTVTSPIVYPEKFVLYLYEIVPDISNIDPIEINENIEIDISVISNTEGGAATIYQPVIFTGINSNINTDYNYNDIMDEIHSLISNSTNPDVRPYYINKPENTMAIQNEDFSNPNIFWDKNNVANNITIGQIDITNSTLDISKSMRGY